MGCDDVMRMIPGWSLFGTIMQCLGVAMFCSSAVLGINAAVQLFTDADNPDFDFDKDVVYFVEIGVYTWTAVTMVWAIWFLFNAFMTTAQTTSNLWEREELCCTSLGCVGTALFFNVVFTMLWITVTTACALPFTFSLMLSEYTNGTDVATVDFSYYGLPYGELVINNADTITHDLIMFFSLAISGAALVTFGMVNSTACMASNWVHLKIGGKLKDYTERRKTDALELQEINVHKSSERLANNLYY